MGCKKKLKKKEQNPHQTLNGQGQKLENKDEILKEYARYYQELLKIRTAEKMQEEEIEQIVDKKFQEVIAGKRNRPRNNNNNRNKESNQGN